MLLVENKKNLMAKLKAKLMLEKKQQQDSGYIMVGQDGTLEGIISKSDITGATSIYLRPIFAKWDGPLDATLQIKIKWIMSRPEQHPLAMNSW